MESIKSVDENGTICYKNEIGLFHREDGPAYECLSGHREWLINNIRHREDGPAVIFSDGDGWYYLNDKRYSKKNYEVQVLKLKLERIKDL